MFIKSVASAADMMDMLRCLQYANYAIEEQDPIASYGPGHEASLLAVAKKYDQSGVFQKWVPCGFEVLIGRYKHGWDERGNPSKELHYSLASQTFVEIEFKKHLSKRFT
jgi:hypothetical protein